MYCIAVKEIEVLRAVEVEDEFKPQPRFSRGGAEAQRGKTKKLEIGNSKLEELSSNIFYCENKEDVIARLDRAIQNINPGSRIESGMTRMRHFLTFRLLKG